MSHHDLTIACSCCGAGGVVCENDLPIPFRWLIQWDEPPRHGAPSDPRGRETIHQAWDGAQLPQRCPRCAMTARTRASGGPFPR